MRPSTIWKWGLLLLRPKCPEVRTVHPHLWPLVSVGEPLLTRYFLYLIPRKPQRWLCVNIPVDQQFCLQTSTVTLPCELPPQSFCCCHCWAPQMIKIFIQLNHMLTLSVYLPCLLLKLQNRYFFWQPSDNVNVEESFWKQHISVTLSLTEDVCLK